MTPAILLYKNATYIFTHRIKENKLWVNKKNPTSYF